MLKRSVEGIISIYSRVDKILQRDRTWLYICLATLHQRSDYFVELYQEQGWMNGCKSRRKPKLFRETFYPWEILPFHKTIGRKHHFQNKVHLTGKINLVKHSINLWLKIIFLRKTKFEFSILWLKTLDSSKWRAIKQLWFVQMGNSPSKENPEKSKTILPKS